MNTLLIIFNKSFLKFMSYIFGPISFIHSLCGKANSLYYELRINTHKKIQDLCSHSKIYGMQERDFSTLDSSSMIFIRVCPNCGLKESSHLAKKIKDDEGFNLLVAGVTKKIQTMKRGKILRLVKHTKNS